MVWRHELTDAQWQKTEPLLPANGEPVGQWADHRTVINGVLYRACTGVPWPDLPERYGPWQTVYERHRRWSAHGTWQQILGKLQIEADATDPDGALVKRQAEGRLLACSGPHGSGGVPHRASGEHRRILRLGWLLTFSGYLRVVTVGDPCGMPVLCGTRMVGA